MDEAEEASNIWNTSEVDLDEPHSTTEPSSIISSSNTICCEVEAAAIFRYAWEEYLLFPRTSAESPSSSATLAKSESPSIATSFEPESTSLPASLSSLAVTPVKPRVRAFSQYAPVPRLSSADISGYSGGSSGVSGSSGSGSLSSPVAPK